MKSPLGSQQQPSHRCSTAGAEQANNLTACTVATGSIPSTPHGGVCCLALMSLRSIGRSGDHFVRRETMKLCVVRIYSLFGTVRGHIGEAESLLQLGQPDLSVWSRLVRNSRSADPYGAKSVRSCDPLMQPPQSGSG